MNRKGLRPRLPQLAQTGSLIRALWLWGWRGCVKPCPDWSVRPQKAEVEAVDVGPESGDQVRPQGLDRLQRVRVLRRQEGGEEGGRWKLVCEQR